MIYMECTGNITNITTDWQTGKFNVTFSLNENSSINEIAKLKEFDKLAIKMTKFRKKRSLDSNAYAWVLFTKIAEVVNSSKDEIYEEMLQKYGYIYQDDDGYITVTVKSEVDMSKIDGHWKFYKSNGKFSSYMMIKGSSQYDSAEMAKFIDHIVQEAKELGIETLTPDELARMNAEWGQKA